MPTVTKYSYTLPADVPQGVAVGNLQNEINAPNSGVTIQVDHIDASPTTLDIYMKDVLSAGEKTALDGDTTAPAGGLLAAHDPTPVDEPLPVEMPGVQKSSTKHMKVEVEPREGQGQNFYTPNMCDQTTWYEGATAETDIALTDSGDLTTWDTNGTHPGPWVDMVHGKMFGEDAIAAASPELLCTVEVSTDGGTTWTPKAEHSMGTTDGDYSVDYVAGSITFGGALNPGDQVRASFSKAAATMLMTIKPETGKRVRIAYVETQMSVDIQLTDKVRYEVWAYDPNDLPNKIKVKESVYKTINDFLYESTGVYPLFPKLDVAGLRGLSQDVLVVPFEYTASRDILDSQGVEIRVKLDTPFNGLLCTSTFYCLVEDEG